MGDDQKDDFWNSDDDFWKKDITADYSGLSKEFKRDEKLREDPYWEKKTVKEENPYHVHQDSGWVMEQHKEEIPVVSQEKKKKKVHVHTIICVTAIVIAVFCAACAVIFSKMAVKSSMDTAMQLSYQETEVSDSFQFNENNRIYLENEAYTIVTEESFKGFPKGLKLIAVYAGVESDEYIRDSYALRDIYIGFEENGKEAYKKPAGSGTASPYLYGYGFNDRQILSEYGIGNGSDRTGYFFFIVPQDVETITLYMEKKKTENRIPVIDTLFIKEMNIMKEDEELTRQLSEREVQ